MSLPQDVVIARGLRAVRNGMLACVAAALALGVFQSAVVLLAGGAATRLGVWPGLTSLLVGQVGALVAGGIGFAGLRRALRPGADIPGVRESTALAMRRVPRPMFAALVLAAAGWSLFEPRAGIEALVLGAVAAQAAFAITFGARLVDGDDS